VSHRVVGFWCPQPKEKQMTLTNLIDLIAEVAPKRAAQESRTKEETPNAVTWMIGKILSRIRRLRPAFSKVGFVFFEAVPQLRGSRRS
jgi:hypothetical protein